MEDRKKGVSCRDCVSLELMGLGTLGGVDEEK